MALILIAFFEYDLGFLVFPDKTCTSSTTSSFKVSSISFGQKAFALWEKHP